MAVTEFFAGIPVANLSSMIAWYERLFGKPPDFFPNDQEAVWQITDRAWVYVVEDAERAGKALITILVDDIDNQVAELAGRDVPVGPIGIMGEGVRHVRIHDPEGNRVTFGQPPAA